MVDRLIMSPGDTTAGNLYEALGGRDGCRALATAFYARVARDPVLRPLFPGKTFTCAIAEFAAFLAHFLGGPDEDREDRWWLSLSESHRRFPIGVRERDAWIADMAAALEDTHIAEPLRGDLLAFFERSSASLVNQGEASAREDGRSGSRDGTNAEIARRWNAQTALDEAVSAVRSGDANRAIALAEGDALRALGPAAVAGLLALMIHRGQDDMVEYARAKLLGDPSLVTAPVRHGRTLLHEASAAGDPATVELLLSLGADANAPDAGGHAPLYGVGNECAADSGAGVVRKLAQGGASVDAASGVKRCTALHMAARRGSVAVAAALLDCGADREARDSSGETPLRRAVNCGKVDVAALLIARGADVHAMDSRGMTPYLAAKTAAMKRLMAGR